MFAPLVLLVSQLKSQTKSSMTDTLPLATKEDIYFLLQNNPVAALELTERLASQFPCDSYIHFLAAEAALENECYEDLISKLDTCIQYYQENSIFARYSAHLNKSSVLHNLKRYEEALESVELAISTINEDADAPPAVNERNPYFMKAMTLRLLKRYEQALECTEICITQYPPDHRFYGIKGDILCCLRRKEEALHTFRHASVINPNAEEIKRHIGTCLVSMKRYEEAVIALEAATNIPRTYIKLGYAYFRLEQYEKALKAYKSAQEMNPESVEKHTEMIDFLEALCDQEPPRKIQKLE